MILGFSDSFHCPACWSVCILSSTILRSFSGERFGSFASRYLICHLSMASLKTVIGLSRNCWNRYVIKSFWVCLCWSWEDVISRRLSLMWMMYLETSSLNWDKVASLILRLIVSTNAMLLRCVLWQMIREVEVHHSCIAEELYWWWWYRIHPWQRLITDEQIPWH